MRKRVLYLSVAIIAVVVFAFAGRSDAGNDPDDTTTGALFSPPSWIIGTWQDAYDTNSYTFESDNITFESSTTTVNFKEAYKEADVSENITDSMYEATVEIESDGTVYTSVYKFEKTSTTAVDYSITTSGVTTGPIELIK